MEQARRLASLGRAARGEAGVKVRQPLARALVFLPSGAPQLLADVVASELNVDEVSVAEELGDVLRFELAANFRTPGPRLGERGKGLKSALTELDGTEAAEALESGRSISVMLDGEAVELGPEDVSLRVRPQQGFAVSREGGEVVALDLSIDDDLRKRGWALRRRAPGSRPAQDERSGRLRSHHPPRRRPRCRCRPIRVDRRRGPGDRCSD